MPTNVSFTLSSQDIASSLTRLNDAFQGRNQHHPIYEDDRIIGNMEVKDCTIYVTFRGSVNSYWEIMTCGNFTKTSLSELGLSGNVHSGMYHAFDKVKDRVYEEIMQKLPKEKGEKGQIVFEGYSRGTTIAALLALYFRQRMLNFICKEDIIPSLATPKCLGFYPVGIQIEFEAKDALSYADRVASKRYTYLGIGKGVFTNYILPWFLPPGTWEAHMPQTYTEAAPSAFEKLNVS